MIWCSGIQCCSLYNQQAPSQLVGMLALIQIYTGQNAIGKI